MDIIFSSPSPESPVRARMTEGVRASYATKVPSLIRGCEPEWRDISVNVFKDTEVQVIGWSAGCNGHPKQFAICLVPDGSETRRVSIFSGYLRALS